MQMLKRFMFVGLVAGLVMHVLPQAAQANHPLAGRWVVKAFGSYSEISLLLLEVVETKDKTEVKILDVGEPQFQGAKIGAVKKGATSLLITVKARFAELTFIARVTNAAKAGNSVNAVLCVGLDTCDPVQFRKTTAKKLDPKKIRVDAPHAEEFKKILKAKTLAAVAGELAKFVGKHPESPLGLQATMRLLLGDEEQLTEKQISNLARQSIKLAAVFGPEMRLQAQREAVNALLTSRKNDALALEIIDNVTKQAQAAHALKRSLVFRQFAVGLIRRGIGKEKGVALAREAVKLSKPLDEQLHASNLMNLTRALLFSNKDDKLALALATETKGLLKKDAPTWAQQAVKKLLARALLKNGKKKEAQALFSEVEKTAQMLDVRFLAKSVPFLPTPYKATKKAGRPVVVELFSGADSPHCIAADIAFDALLRTFSPKSVVFLRYHLHSPTSDPLTNPSGEARADDYGVKLTPTFFVDGKRFTIDGGSEFHAKLRYGKLRRELTKKVGQKRSANIELKAVRKKDKVTLTAKITGLPATQNLRLHLFLVEKVVRYEGANGRRLHQNVVRDMPSSAGGIEIKTKEALYERTIDLPKLRRRLHAYLNEMEKFSVFYNDDRHMKFKDLYALALVQNSDTNAILDVVQVIVPKSKG